MRHHLTRRKFLGTAGAIVAAAGGAWAKRPVENRVSGAKGVELNVENSALPDYSHDLERYLIRLTSEARARRKLAIDAISTPQGLVERQKLVAEQVWKMLGGPFERTPL